MYISYSLERTLKTERILNRLELLQGPLSRILILTFPQDVEGALPRQYVLELQLIACIKGLFLPFSSRRNQRTSHYSAGTFFEFPTLASEVLIILYLPYLLPF